MEKRVRVFVEFDDTSVDKRDVAALQRAIFESTELAGRLIKGNGSAVLEITLSDGIIELPKALVILKAALAQMPKETSLKDFASGPDVKTYKDSVSTRESGIITGALSSLDRAGYNTIGEVWDEDPRIFENIRNIREVKADFLRKLFFGR